MALEAESRFQVAEQRAQHIREDLGRSLRLGPYQLRPGGAREHADTYFDVDGRLYSRNWSLRLREVNGEIQATLKRPASGPASGSGVREELENPSAGSLMEILRRIADELQDAGIIGPHIEPMEQLVLREGARGALRSLGLSDLFTVCTLRYTWIAGDGQRDLAELALDESEYTTGTEGSAREARIEIELYDAADLAALADMTRRTTARFDAEEVYESKFDRGMVHYRTRNLRDKMEAKVTVAYPGDYDTIIRIIDGPDEFVHGHHFSRTSSERLMTDTYFDTKSHDLFKRGWYLRLRHESDQEQLTFRRLTEDVRYGQVLQEEIVARGSGEGFAKSWKSIQEWLTGIGNVSPAEPGQSGSDMEPTFIAMGLRPSLNTTIIRTTWIVERAGTWASGDQDSTHVAKLKYDRVTFRCPNSSHPDVSTAEFEVTGVEDDSAAPQFLRRDPYQSFLAQFVEACAHSTSDRQADQRISAKYFQGLLTLGIITTLPKWLDDGRLALRTSLLRDNQMSPAVQRTNWAMVRFLIAVMAIIAGLFALATGADGGLLTSGDDQPSAWSLVMQSAGFLALVAGSVYLFRNPGGGPLPTTPRILIVAGCVVAAVGISIPWAGRGASADVTALLGLLPLLVALSRRGFDD